MVSYKKCTLYLHYYYYRNKNLPSLIFSHAFKLNIYKKGYFARDILIIIFVNVNFIHYIISNNEY